VILSPAFQDQHRAAREARLELALPSGPLPEGIPVHVKVDTGMGRWGLRDEVTTGANVVGLMSHLASADSDPAYTELQIARFAEIAEAHPGLTRHLANSAGILRYPAALFDAGRPGIALYGLSPFGVDPADDGLVPVLSWRSAVAQIKQLLPGESTGYSRRFVVAEPTWIGIVPAGYADGWRRGLTGTEVLVAGERRPVVGTISMDSFAVELP
jgi:alanine racemase